MTITHNGYAVFEIVPDDGLGQNIGLKQVKIGVESFNADETYEMQDAIETVTHGFTVDAVTLVNFYDFFAQQRGMADEFILPSYALDLRVSGKNTDTVYTVKGSLQDYFVQMRIGFVHYKNDEVVQVVEGTLTRTDADTSVLELVDSPLEDIAPGDVLLLAKLARFDTDEFRVPTQLPASIQMPFKILGY